MHDVDEHLWDPQDLPILGEPFAVELANTDYRTERERFDVLADTAATAAWFAAVPAEPALALPSPISAPAMASLRAVRDATRRVLLTSTGDAVQAEVEAAVRTLNDAAGRATATVQLETGSAGFSWQLVHTGAPLDVLTAAIATRCVRFVGSDDLAHVRRCRRPDCPMLFVQRHRRRVFCHESCAHRTRQARYYRRSHQRQPRSEPLDGRG